MPGTVEPASEVRQHAAGSPGFSREIRVLAYFRASAYPLAHAAILVADGRRADFAAAIFLCSRMPHAGAVREGLRGETRRGPRRPEIVAIIAMQGLEPAISRVRVPGLSRVVFPRRLERFECAIAASLPGYVDQQLGQRAKPFLSSPQFLVLDVAFDEIGSETREYVELPQVPLRGCVRPLPVRRDHPDEFAAASQQRSGLSGVNARCEQLRLIRRARHELAVLYILRDDPFPPGNGDATGAGRVGADPGPEFRRLLGEAVVADELQLTAGTEVRVVALHAREIGMHDGLCDEHEFGVEPLEICLVRHLEAEVLQEARRRELVGEFGLALDEANTGAVTLDRECELAGDDEAHRNIVFRERVRLAKIRHEFSDQRTFRHQGNEGNRMNAFLDDGRLEAR